jgi:hypothetical protein
VAGFGRKLLPRENYVVIGNEAKIMTDLIYIGVIVLFFLVSGLYVRFCEKL